MLGIIGIAKRGTLSAETVGLGSILRVAPFARCANSCLSLTNDRPGLLGAAAPGSRLGNLRNGDAYSGVLRLPFQTCPGTIRLRNPTLAFPALGLGYAPSELNGR